MAISPELARIYATAPTDDYHVETLELLHPNFASGVRYITNQAEPWTGRVPGRYPTDQFPDTWRYEVFEPVPFAVVPPKAEDEGALTLSVALDNASRELMAELENLATAPNQPIRITYRVYLASDIDTIQNVPPLVLDVPSVTASPLTISFQAGLANLHAMPFPALIYTVDLYPGLQR